MKRAGLPVQKSCDIYLYRYHRIPTPSVTAQVCPQKAVDQAILILFTPLESTSLTGFT
jgi:hypothetical protein